MNQIKIGRFIAECRKEKKLTQVQLAEKLGVSDRSVSKWENGRCLPDLSLFEPLCNELEITINEFLSGERIEEKDYKEKLEENLIETIDYTNKKVFEKDKLIAKIILCVGLLVIFAAFSIFPTESSWASIYSIIGTIISLVGVCKLINLKSLKQNIVFSVFYMIFAILALFGVDYVNVKLNNTVPRFSYLIETGDTMTVYRSPFCNVYRINRNTKNEYYIVDTKKVYTEDTVPTVPFNREKCGIDNIIKYKNEYLGNNSNTGNLINNLPLSEYGYLIELDSKENGVIIDYHITDWYIVEDMYLQKGLVYNSVAIFSLIDNVEYIKYNFTGGSYIVNRNIIEDEYPNFKEIVVNEELSKDNFNKYVEQKVNDDEFIEEIFEKILK